MVVILDTKWIEQRIKEIDEEIEEIRKAAKRRLPKIPKRPEPLIPAFQLPTFGVFGFTSPLKTLVEKVEKAVGFSIRIPSPKEIEDIEVTMTKSIEELDKALEIQKELAERVIPKPEIERKPTGKLEVKPAPPKITPAPAPSPAAPAREYKSLSKEDVNRVASALRKIASSTGLRTSPLSREEIRDTAVVVSPKIQEKIQNTCKVAEAIANKGHIESHEIDAVHKVIQEAGKAVGWIFEPGIRAFTNITNAVAEGIKNAINTIKNIFGWK
ncbi:MAG: hypothetical protein DRJ44_03920 [Thermoprotei archaeon]|nr:MAG: hypothetical protein DRJ44_03920 [Thermoprotei archaeon]